MLLAAPKRRCLLSKRCKPGPSLSTIYNSTNSNRFVTIPIEPFVIGNFGHGGRGGAINADRGRMVEEWKTICEEKGDAVLGKELFLKYCSVCHQHSGLGQSIGPDLTGMAVHPKHELLTHILDPNRSVEGNFRIYTLMTVDGIVVSGMMAGESRTSVELIDAQGKRQTIQRDEIERFVASRKSLMPEGFENQLDRNAMRNLLEFLTAKGKYVPLSIDKVATAISTKGLFHDGDKGPDRLVFPDWKPRSIAGIPFQLVNPQEGRVPNIILLNGPRGTMPPKMPRTVIIPCHSEATAIHLLSGISGGAIRHIASSRLDDRSTALTRWPNRRPSLINGVHFCRLHSSRGCPRVAIRRLPRQSAATVSPSQTSANGTAKRGRVYQRAGPDCPNYRAVTLETGGFAIILVAM